MDIQNMLEGKRRMTSKISRMHTVTRRSDQGISDRDVHIGPSDHVPWLDDRKWALIRLEGRNFGDVPLNVELKLEVHDSPNSAGVIIDAVRCAKRSEEHTSELQSLMRISYAVFCLKKKKNTQTQNKLTILTNY